MHWITFLMRQYLANTDRRNEVLLRACEEDKEIRPIPQALLPYLSSCSVFYFKGITSLGIEI